MYNIAILGFGVVGCGTAEVLAANRESIKNKCGDEINLKYILDIRDFPDSPFADLVIHDIDTIINDPNVKCCVETIGGARIAYEFTKKALSSGKSVVTSNKELVSTKGPELLKLARENNCSYLFEASVGGGIPIIRPLYRCLAANNILKICGIVNGTTNYILSSMKNKGLSYDEALSRAQVNGFAEADPTADVEGIDAQRKLSILSTIAMNGVYVSPEEIMTRGVSDVTLDDINFADSVGCQIKLIAFFKKLGDKCTAYVMPHFVPRTKIIGNVDDVYNCVSVEGDFVGETLFYGQGAGSSATASAVCGDIIELAACGNSEFVHPWDIAPESIVIPYDEVKCDFIFWGDMDASAFEGFETESYDKAVIIRKIRDNEARALADKANAQVMHFLR
ncbi:homoserine dehydrogenase [Ruminococcaceae bacterium YRB3002]|nr:homoserine dehydrogenase [Ruminococcaceae bacterium YRB3002]